MNADPPQVAMRVGTVATGSYTHPNPLIIWPTATCRAQFRHDRRVSYTWCR